MPTSEDCATLAAYIAGVDQAARAAETKWGMDRLPMLVTDDLRAKFNRQSDLWSQAVSEAHEAKSVTRDQMQAVVARSAAMQRAWAALDAAAEEAGHRPIAPWVWEVRLKDGTVAALVQTNAEASHVIAEGRHVAVYTAEEIGNLIDSLGAISLAKQIFPGVKVEPRRDTSWVRHGDPVPF